MGHEGTTEIPQESLYALEAAKASPNCSQTMLFFTANELAGEQNQRS